MKYFFYHFPNVPCLKYTVNSNFPLIRRKTLLTNDFELTVPDLYVCAFEIPQVLFAFEFESEWLNGNSVTKQSSNYHLSDFDKIGQNAK